MQNCEYVVQTNESAIPTGWCTDSIFPLAGVTYASPTLSCSAAMAGAGKTLVLFDVDGTLTKPRNVGCLRRRSQLLPLSLPRFTCRGSR